MRLFSSLIVAIVTMTGAACGGDATNARNDYLVGYYLSATHVAEHYRHTDLAWARATEHSHAELKYIHESYGQQLVIDTGRFWFPALATTGEFRPERYRARLSEWWQGVDYPVWMLYPLDEPRHNMARNDVPGDHVAMYERIVQITREVTGARIGVILTPESAVNHPVPAGVDVAGVSCFRDACLGRTQQQIIDTLKGQVRHTMIVPPAFSAVGGEAELIERLESARRVAESDASVAAFVPFIWWSRANGNPPWLGVEDMPEVRDWMVRQYSAVD